MVVLTRWISHGSQSVPAIAKKHRKPYVMFPTGHGLGLPQVVQELHAKLVGLSARRDQGERRSDGRSGKSDGKNVPELPPGTRKALFQTCSELINLAGTSTLIVRALIARGMIRGFPTGPTPRSTTLLPPKSAASAAIPGWSCGSSTAHGWMRVEPLLGAG